MLINDTRTQVVASLKDIQQDMQQITAEITVLLDKSGGVADGAEGPDGTDRADISTRLMAQSGAQ